MRPTKAILRWSELIEWLKAEGYSVRQIKRLKAEGHISTYRWANRPKGHCRYLTVQVYRDVLRKRLIVKKKRGRPKL